MLSPNSVTCFIVSGSPQGYILTSLEPSPGYIVAAATPPIISSPWSASHILLCFISPIQTLLHCSFFMFSNLLSLFHFWFCPVVPSPPFFPAPSSCDPRAWRRGEWRLAAGSTAARGYFLPPYGRFRLGYEKSSPSALHLPPPAILLHTSSSAARCSSPSLPSFSLSLSFSGSPRPLPHSLLRADGNLSGPGCDSGARNRRVPWGTGVLRAERVFMVRARGTTLLLALWAWNPPFPSSAPPEV